MLNFSLNFERKCKLIKEEKLANKNWVSPISFKSYLENKQKHKLKHWSNQTNYGARTRVTQSCSRFFLGRTCAELMRTNNGHKRL